MSRLRRTTILAMVATLTFGVPGTQSWATGNESEAAASPMAVATEPAGAEVYVDGSFQGTAPVNVSGLPAGDHRVRVAKDGYLDNSRVVSVRKGEPQAVHVRLTPNTNPPAARLQVDRDKQTGGSQGGGGGGKKWIFIGAGVAVAGAGAFLLLRDTNKAPVVTGATATPSTGLAGATTITLTAQASDPDGDALTYNWNFGDSGTGSGQSVTHVYQSAPTSSPTVTVTDGKKTAAAVSANVTIRTLSGTWRGTLDNFFQAAVSLSQNGTGLSGSYTDQTGATTAGPVVGSVSGPNRVTFTVDPACCIPFTFSGTVDEGINRITGTANGSGFVNAPWSLTRQ